MLQFSMHANLIHANITVDVPTQPTGLDVYAMKNIQEGPALVGVIIIIIPVSSVSCKSKNLLISGNMNTYLSNPGSPIST